MLTAADVKVEVAAFGKHNHERIAQPPAPLLSAALLIIKRETESEAAMFNSLLCKLFGE